MYSFLNRGLRSLAFTMIEGLLVIVILAILVGIVIVAVKPNGLGESVVSEDSGEDLSEESIETEAQVDIILE